MQFSPSNNRCSHCFQHKHLSLSFANLSTLPANLQTFLYFGSYLLSLGSSFLGAPPGVLAAGPSLIFFPSSLFVIANNDIVINVKMPRSPYPLFLRLFGMGGFDLISWLDLILWHGFDLISCVDSIFFPDMQERVDLISFLSLCNC